MIRSFNFGSSLVVDYLVSNLNSILMCIIVAVLVSWSAKRVHASTQLLEELEHAEQINDAWRTLIDARLTLEQEKLGRTQALAARGHASWLETSGQAATVDALIEHQQAAIRLHAWLDDLRVSLELPPSKSIERVTDTYDSARADSDADRLQLLQRSADRAHKDFFEMLGQEARSDNASARHNDAQRMQSTPPNLCDMPPGPLAVLRLASDPKLAKVTIQLANSVARQSADVKIATLLLRKSQMRLSAVETLHQKGFATDAELAQARQVVSDKQQALTQISAKTDRRRKNWSLIQRQFATADVFHPTAPTIDTKSADLPIQYASSLRYYIAIHVAQFQAEARRGEANVEARRLAERLRRLEQSGSQHVSARRERALARIDLGLARAQANAEQEQLVAWEHESRRFIADLQVHRLTHWVTGRWAERVPLLNEVAALTVGRIRPELTTGYLAWTSGWICCDNWLPLPSSTLYRNTYLFGNLPSAFCRQPISYWHSFRATFRCRTTRWRFVPRLAYARNICDLGGYLDAVHYRRLLSRVGVRPSLRPWGFPAYYDFYSFGRQYPSVWTSSWRTHCFRSSRLWPVPASLWSRL